MRCTPRDDVYLMDAYLIGMHLMDVYLIETCISCILSPRLGEIHVLAPNAVPGAPPPKFGCDAPQL